jgi:plastocyanin
MKRMFLAAGIVAALAATASCTANAGAPDASPVATTSVQLPPSYRFEPAVIAVAAGATVTWTNADHFTHNVRCA